MSAESPELPLPAPRFEVTAERVGVTVAVLHLTGEADHDARHALDVAFDNALAEEPDILLVDLAPLTFCDSSCLNTLLRAHAAAEAAGIWMVLVGAGPQLLHLLAVTGTDEVFTVRSHLRATRPEHAAPPR